MELIGRDAELSLVTSRLHDRRLVTLVGPGGIGKTALARAAVERCKDAFGDGARTVDLTRVDSAAAVRETLATQLGYTSFRALLDAPGDHPILLLVDNCEHVLDAVADALEQLLEACQMPTVLATSRTALELPGETLVPVGPLALPPKGVTDAPAVRLFVERARDAGTDLDPASVGGVVAELCRRLDGVPLAIELAAARARAMTPAEILDRLATGLDVLDRPRRRGARRHQSLRAAIAWSYDLLEEDERLLFDRLSVFAGPFTAHWAHAVAGAPGTTAAGTQDVLDRLVSTSMVVADPSGPTAWYRELDTLRAFARDRLEARGQRREVETRFVDHVVEQVAGIIERGAANWSADALADLLALYDNITAALRWCIAEDNRPDRAFLLVAALWGVVHQAHTEDIGALAEQVIARWPAGENPLRSDAVATAATCRYMLGDDAGAVALAEAALPAANASPYAPATLRRAIAQSRRASGDTGEALAWFEDEARVARDLGLTALAVEADAARAQILADLGRIDAALELAGVAQAEAATAHAPVAGAWVRAVEGSILLRADVDRAAAVLEEALGTSRRLGYAAGVSANLRSLALADLLRGDTGGAARRVLALLDELLGRGSIYELRLVFDAASAALARAGRAGVAADLAATALDLPVVSITASVGHELFPLDAAGGRVLGVREAILTTRAELAQLAAAGALDAAARDRAADTGQAAETVHGPETVQAADSREAEGREAAERGEAVERREAATVTGEATGVFRQVGDVWELAYAGEVTRLRATKGLADIAQLLAAGGREVHCLELVGAGVEEGTTGEVLDGAARRAYETRARELQAELDDAEAAADIGRAERARTELDALVDQLAAAVGLGGRARRTGGAAERARSAVTQRIRSTIRRIDAVHPRLGRHLHAAIRTGVFCAYAPETPVRWQL